MTETRGWLALLGLVLLIAAIFAVAIGDLALLGERGNYRLPVTVART